MRILLTLLLMATAAPAAAAVTVEARSAFRDALDQVERGVSLDRPTRAQLATHPLRPWLEYAELRAGLSQAGVDEVTRTLQRHAALPFAGPLRRAFLHELARRRDWPALLALYRDADASDVALHCRMLQARLNVAPAPAVFDTLAAVWSHGDSRPPACDPAFEALAKAGRIDAALRWQRIERAAVAGNVGLMRFVARGLDAPGQALATNYADFLESPARSARDWPRDARSRAIAASGLTRLARRDPGAAERLLSELTPLGLDADQVGTVRHAIALWSAASYLPEAARRLAAVPTRAFDAPLHEWRAREALARSDHAAALAAIKAMPEALRIDPRWRYLEARLRDLEGDAAGAAKLFEALAGEANYHGFLAADRLGRDYALCPEDLDDDAERADAVAALPGLVRAIELYAIDRSSWARQEWDLLVPTLDADSRRRAVALAIANGWTDRAVFGLAGAEDQRHYRLRFPLGWRTTLRRETRTHDLDLSWVAALIRAESAWQPDAHSHANARGLMQLLPGTGQPLARRLGLAWAGPQTLFRAQTNLALGTAHLAELLPRYGGQPYLVTAAYNAGPAPVGRWLAQRPALPPDLWVETIPYRETREYVGRIMAFSVIYDWRLGGKATPLSARMRGDRAVAQRAFACPIPSAAIASTP